MKPKTFQMRVKHTPYTEMKEVRSLGVYGNVFGVSKSFSKHHGEGFGVTYIPTGDRCGFSYSLARARDLAKTYAKAIPPREIEAIGDDQATAAKMLWPVFSKWKSEQIAAIQETAHA